MSGKDNVSSSLERDAKKQALIEQLRAKYGKAEELGPITEEDRARMDEGMNRGSSDNIPPLGEKETAPSVPKQTPIEVALLRINQATTFTKEALINRINKTIDYLENFDKDNYIDDTPGSDYNAKKAAIQQELEAYKAILRGEKPDYSWFEGKGAVPKEKPSIEVPNDSWERINEAPPLGDERPPVAGENRVSEVVGDGLSAQDYFAVGPQQIKTFGDVLREGIPEGRPSLAQSVAAINYKLRGLELKLQSVVQKINDFKTGLSPSGTVDINKLTQYRKSLENQMAWLEKVKQDNLDKIIEQNKGKEEKPLPKEQVPSEPTKFTSLPELLASNDKSGWVSNFMDNLHLFDTFANTKLYFDKDIDVGTRRIYLELLKAVGMGKDQVFILKDDVFPERPDGSTPPQGNAMLYGNSTVIRLSPARLEGRVTAASKLLPKLVKSAVETFEVVRVATHEIGHVLLYKYLKAFANTEADMTRLEEAWRIDQSKKGDVISPSDLYDKKGLAARQEIFTEFFAENVSKTLTWHVLGKLKFHTNKERSAKIAVQINAVINSAMSLFKGNKIDINKSTFVNELVNDLISRNEKTIKETGLTVFEEQQLRNNDRTLFSKEQWEADLFRHATLEDIRRSVDERGWASPVDDLNITKAGIVGLSTRASIALGKLGGFAIRKMFSKNNLARIYADYPVVQRTHQIIRNAEEKGNSVFAKLWFGDTVGKPWDKAGLLQKLSKVKLADAPFTLVRKATDADMKSVHDLFKQGYEKGLDYADTLSQFGQNLTKDQQLLFTKLGEMFKKMYDETVKAEQALGKKNLLPYKNGWYPSVRKGIYSVEVSFNGRTFRREHFDTKVAAERFQRSLSKAKNIDVSEIMERDSEAQQSNQMMADIIKDLISRKFPTGAPKVNAEIDALLNRMATGGGNKTSHHNFRSNMLGYKGTELLKTAEEQGNSFREAIQALGTEYPTSITRNYIKTLAEPLLKQTSGKERDVIEQMMNSALGRNKDITSKLTRFGDNIVEQSIKYVYEDVFNKEYKVDSSVSQRLHNSAVSWFYLLKVIPRLQFILSQFLTVPAVTQNLSYGGHGIRAWYSLGKGLANLAAATVDHPAGKELRAAWDYVSQNFTTFEPKFVEDLKLATGENRSIEFIKDYVLLRKPSEVSDSLSRLMGFSIAFTHYRDLGYDVGRASKEARRITDDTMNVYTTADSAPMFEHMGNLGRTVRPLQSFGNNLLGNFVAAVKHFEAKDINTWGPLVNYALTTTLVSGVMGGIFIQEYELLRRLMNTKFGMNMPSIIEMFSHDDSMLDRVLPDDDAIRAAMLYGIPSMSGVDLSGSTRANKTFLTLAGSVLLAEESWTKLMPALGLAHDQIGGGIDLIKSKVGDTDVATTGKAVDAVFPAGHLGYAAKEVAGVNTTKVMGSNTDMIQYGKHGLADKPRETKDVVAGIIGSRSTEDKYLNQMMASQQFNEKTRTDRIKQAANMFAETGNQKYVKALIDLNADGNEIESMVSTEVYKRLVSQDTRFIADKGGNVSKSGQRKAVGLFKFGKPQ